MSFSLTEDFKTVAELAGQADQILDQVRETGRPVATTRDGKPAAVVLDVARYEWMIHLLNLSRLLNEGMTDVCAGRVKPIDQVFKEMGVAKKKVSR